MPSCSTDILVPRTLLTASSKVPKGSVSVSFIPSRIPAPTSFILSSSSPPAVESRFSFVSSISSGVCSVSSVSSVPSVPSVPSVSSVSSPFWAASASSLVRPTNSRDSSAISSAFKVPSLSRLNKPSLKAGYSVSSSGKLLGLNSSPSVGSLSVGVPSDVSPS